jgi:hypothetical protein
MGFRYVSMVGEIVLAGIFLVAVIAGIRSWLWKGIWLAAAGSLWYVAGLFGAAPLMILVILRVATTIGSTARTLPAKDGVPPGVDSARA